MPEGRLARDTRLRSLESSGPSLDVRDGVSDFLLAILKTCGQKHINSNELGHQFESIFPCF